MHPGTIGSNALKTLKASWRKTFHGGVGSKFETAILEEGMQYKPIQLRPDEAQFLATRKFSILEISRIFRVPPHLLGDLERATFSNIEHQSIEFVIHTINPVAVKLEQELNKKLIPEADKGNTYFEHNNNQLLRGDAKARAEYYAKLFQVGAITPNEIRRRENMNDVDNGDSLYVPMNYININDKNPKADEKGNKTA
jgi:HK97 family phage portal protein